MDNSEPVYVFMYGL